LQKHAQHAPTCTFLSKNASGPISEISKFRPFRKEKKGPFMLLLGPRL
jgi:hypothetical protein